MHYQKVTHTKKKKEANKCMHEAISLFLPALVVASLPLPTALSQRRGMPPEYCA